MAAKAYIAQCRNSGLIKIGCSQYPESRVQSLRLESGEEMVLLRTLDGAFLTEKWLHKRFSESWVKGEWFRFNPEMLTVEVPPSVYLRFRHPELNPRRIDWTIS